MAAKAPRLAVDEVRWRVKVHGLPRGNDDNADLIPQLVSDEVITSVVLLIGLPPFVPEPRDDDTLESFAAYVHDLAVWSMNAKGALMEIWGVEPDEYDAISTYQRAFGEALVVWYGMRDPLSRAGNKPCYSEDET